MTIDLQTPPEAAGARPASVNLRTTGAADETGPLLDPANQSLAETLALVFKVLQFAMLVLLVLFVLSGFGQIKEGESGVRLLFGRKTADRLPPGPSFSAPFPMGELIKVDVGVVPLNIDQSFWPKLTDEQKKMSLGQLASMGKPSLKPGDDGSLITGDQNIVHSTWSVHYVRRDPATYIENILPEDEAAIVRSAVERGIVQAVAQTRIDDLLKQSFSDQASVARQARDLAQRLLDEIDSGIQIHQVTLSQMAPPFIVLNDFFNVQSAEQRAGKAREEAMTEARDILNSVAGAAHAPLVEQIDAYERAVASGDTAEQERILGIIHAIFDGREVKIGDRTIAAGLVAGKVTDLLADAMRYRSSIVSQRAAELDRFHAVLAQFRSNPNLVVQREWADAMSVFLDHPYVEVFSLPSSVETVELWLNRDPSIVKTHEQAAKEEQLKRERAKREAEQLQERFRTRTDLQILNTR